LNFRRLLILRGITRFITYTTKPNTGFRLGKPLTLAAMSLGFGVV
jgi:hypothetical protein